MVISSVATIVPFTTDHLLASCARFVHASVSHHGRVRCINIIGDGTHNQTSQGLKNIVLGLLGTHFNEGAWFNSIIPGVYTACHQETIVSLRQSVAAFVHGMQHHHSIDLKLYIAAWY